TFCSRATATKYRSWRSSTPLTLRAVGGCAYQQRGRRSWWQPHGGVMETAANAPAGARQPVTVRLAGGPAALIEIGGLRLLTDPVLDAPGLIAGSTRSPARTGDRPRLSRGAAAAIPRCAPT